MIRFDPEAGQLSVEAGVLLAAVIAAFPPRGSFAYVVPGTRYVTIGGALAPNVHGKNHHNEALPLAGRSQTLCADRLPRLSA